MGLFTRKCINPECGYRIRKGAKFCPKCGSGSPAGTIRCGGCGEDVRSSSKYCWKCGVEMAVAAAPQFTSDRWARSPEDFAVRVDVDDVRGWLVKPLIIEHGTRALLFQAGKFAGELDAGRYDMDGFVSRLTNCMIDRAASMVLMDAGDVTLDLENGSLWTTNKFEVGASVRLVASVMDPDALFVNLIKGRGRVTLDDVECLLADEVQMLLGGIVAKYRADQLFSSLDARYEIEVELREHLSTTFKRFGLSLAQLRFIDFVGEAFEELRRQRSDLQVDESKADLTTQRYRLNQRLREALTQEQMDEFKNPKDLEDFIRQTEHELGLKAVIRDDEMERLKERFAFERNRESVLRRVEIEAIEDDQVRERAWKDLLAEERELDERHRREVERDKSGAQAGAGIADIERGTAARDHDEDVRQARDGLGLLKDVKDIEHEEDQRKLELERQALEQRSKATVEALISITDGPAAERLAELEKLRQRQSMTPEQILALAAEASPAAAQALAKKYEAEGRLSEEVRAQLEQRVAEQRELAESQAGRMERMMQTALEQMGGVATTRARPPQPGSPTIVTPGGQGTPIVISQQQASVSQSSGGCKHCGAALEHDGNFCPECGKKQ